MVEISVIIPLYNKEKYISTTIESVLNQIFREFELLIVNDCSTDQSLKIVEQINDDRIKIIQHQENSGLSASRNTGIKAAQGKIITFLDADDLWKEDFLFHIDKLSGKFTNCDIFATDYFESYENKLHSTKKNLNHTYKANQYIEIEDFFKASVFNPIYCFSSVAFSKKAIDKVGFFDKKINYGEDIDYNIRVNTKFNLAYFHKPCAVYRLGVDKQITANGIIGKNLPDLSSYKNVKTRKALDLYINMKYYYYASQFKKAQDDEMFKKYIEALNFSQLSKKQILLLKSPYWLYEFLKQTKAFLLKKGIKVTPY
ncbi:glycosyltransferase family 2 protein [Mesonia aestuariivivens]|uniref:Glycosyltransferase family 2 protein n=1 Tax=Mesonia aestuariivivens TaxID=2796128 RepID=A0ABS6VZD1_9FLAO|nr:glycosyltransferase family A protein [Mesonia aestuariivivens]MBW2960859.1 glycosyltransferase family 2 protein [Mesonia aestuariivivens]